MIVFYKPTLSDYWATARLGVATRPVLLRRLGFLSAYVAMAVGFFWITQRLGLRVSFAYGLVAALLPGISALVSVYVCPWVQTKRYLKQALTRHDLLNLVEWRIQAKGIELARPSGVEVTFEWGELARVVETDAYYLFILSDRTPNTYFLAKQALSAHEADHEFRRKIAEFWGPIQNEISWRKTTIPLLTLLGVCATAMAGVVTWLLFVPGRV